MSDICASLTDANSGVETTDLVESPATVGLPSTASCTSPPFLTGGSVAGGAVPSQGLPYASLSSQLMAPVMPSMLLGNDAFSMTPPIDTRLFFFQAVQQQQLIQQH